MHLMLQHEQVNALQTRSPRSLCTSGYVGCSLTPKRQPLYSTFLRKEQPSVSRALPPVGWQSTVEQPLQMTTVCACEKTVVLRGKNVGKDESESQAARRRGHRARRPRAATRTC